MLRKTTRGRTQFRPTALAVLVGCVLTLVWAPMSLARLGFDQVAPRLLEAWSYCAYGLSEFARPIFSKVANHDPTAVEAVVALGLIADARGSHEAALDRYEEAAATSSTMDAALFTLQGDVYLRSGDPGRAASRYREALRLDEELARAHYGLGVATEILGRSGEWPPPVEHASHDTPGADWRSAAIGQQVAALEQAPDLTDAHIRVARLLIESAGDEPDPSSEKLQEALVYLTRARILDERNPQVHILMGQAYEATGQEAEARHAFRRARQLTTGQTDIDDRP